jgi:hypothetical protein
MEKLMTYGSIIVLAVILVAMIMMNMDQIAIAWQNIINGTHCIGFNALWNVACQSM